LAVATGHAQRQHQSLLQTLRAIDHSPGFLDLPPDALGPIHRLLEDLDAMLPLSTKENTGEVLFQYLSTQTGVIEQLSNSARPADVQRVQNLARLFSIIERFARVARYDRVAWFIDYLDDLIEAGDNPPVGDAGWDTDAVSVLTIHQAKGLEFPIVFLVGLVSGRFPSAHRSDPIPLPDRLIKDLVSGSDFHRQEERRLFYVGMTRAKEDVYFTSGQDYGGKRPRKPSLFVSEALDLDAGQFAPERRSPLLRMTRHAGGAAPNAVHEPELTLFPQGDEILTLSHRRINDFLTCPKKYKYVHILRVPVRPHHAVVYGSAIHHAIRIFQMNRIAGQETPLSVLHEAFRKAWQSEGFLTRQHEDLRMKEGMKALAAFHAMETASSSLPTYVEKRFSVTLDDVRLIGIFDRIDDPQDAGGGTLIDYKTSDVRTEDEANRRTESSLQLALYALAYEQLFDGLPAEVQLRFLTPDVVVGRAAPSAKMLRKAREQLRTAADGIRMADFTANPTYRACEYCPYAGICPDRV